MVLVTGGTGFLGKHLQKAFKAHPECDVTYVGRSFNLKSFAETETDLRYYKPDIIIHAAAVCGGILANKNSPADFLRDNAQMGLNIFEAGRVHDVQYLYTLGSVCSYPKFCPVPFKEDNIWNGYPEETNAPYGMAKRMLLMLQQSYRSQYGIKGAHLIPVNMYGEHDHFDLVNSHVIPALINKFTTAVRENRKTVQCWGTGDATREFLYAGDAAEAMVKAVVTGLDTDLPINLGTGIDISIKDLAYLIGEIVGFSGEIEFTGDVSDGQPKRRLDVSRAKELLGWHARVALEDGLRKTIEWYKNLI